MQQIRTWPKLVWTDSGLEMNDTLHNVQLDGKSYFLGREAHNVACFDELMQESKSWNIKPDTKTKIIDDWMQEWFKTAVLYKNSFAVHVAHLRYLLAGASEPITLPDVVTGYAQILDMAYYLKCKDAVRHADWYTSSYILGEYKVRMQIYEEYPKLLQAKLYKKWMQKQEELQRACGATLATTNAVADCIKAFKTMNDGIRNYSDTKKENTMKQGTIVMFEEPHGKYKKILWLDWRNYEATRQDTENDLQVRTQQCNTLQNALHEAQNERDVLKNDNDLLRCMNTTCTTAVYDHNKMSKDYNAVLKLFVNTELRVTSEHDKADLVERQNLLSNIVNSTSVCADPQLRKAVENYQITLKRLIDECDRMKEQRIDKECADIVIGYESLTKQEKTLEVYADACIKYAKIVGIVVMSEDVRLYEVYWKNNVSIARAIKDMSC